MRLIKKILFAVAVLFYFMNMQCESNDDALIIDTDNLLLGHWEAPQYEGNKITFKRAIRLPEQGFGVQFKAKGQLVEHTAGWGATPPLNFSNRNAKWELIDNVIAVTQDYFPNGYTWNIEALTTTELVVRQTVTAQEAEHMALLEDFNKIEEDLKGFNCENVTDWGIASYGAKACGGVKGYLSYPKAIDTTAFLNSIANYTKAEAAYNKKWGVFSTCEVLKAPKTVVCDNDAPVLVFE